MQGGKTSGAEVRPLGRLGHVVRLLGVPELLVLLASEALVVVALALEQLLKVRLAVELPLKGSKGANTAETTGIGDRESRRREGEGQGREGGFPT